MKAGSLMTGLALALTLLVFTMTATRAQTAQAQTEGETAEPAEVAPSVVVPEASSQIRGPNARIGEAFSRAGEDTSPEADFAFGAYQRGMYLTAFDLALPRAEAGDAAAQTLIAELYDLGRGVAQDTRKAAEWYEVAAKSGNREAQFSFAMKLIEGVDVPRDKGRAIELLKEAAEDGHPLAMFNYASHLIDQRPTSLGYRQALPLLERAAEFRLSDAYYLLAKIYTEGLATGVGDPEKGKEWMERAARSGIDTAQVELGIALMNGLYGKRDETLALRWFATAAQSGNVIAQNRLAHMLFGGIGAEHQPVEAAKWHILAKRAGRADPLLDQLLRQLGDDDRKEALKRANRWPL
jgi:TPR repeat protein